MDNRATVAARQTDHAAQQETQMTNSTPLVDAMGIAIGQPPISVVIGLEPRADHVRLRLLANRRPCSPAEQQTLDNIIKAILRDGYPLGLEDVRQFSVQLRLMLRHVAQRPVVGAAAPPAEPAGGEQ